MSGAATPPLAAAVSNAGALGMLGIGRQSPVTIAAYLDELGTLTSAPVGCTFIAPFVTDEVVEMVAARLPIVEFFYAWPDATRLPLGPVCGWQVGSVDEARAAVDAGCHYVIAQGIEAGGHVRGTVPLARLVDEIRSSSDVLIVAAGGIGSANDVRAALALGADAVRVGTRFVAAVESNAHPAYADALVAANADDTVLTEAFGVGWPDAPHRVLASSVSAAEATGDEIVGEARRPDGTTAPMPRFPASLPTRDTIGDIAAMALYAGTSVGAVHRRQHAAEVVAELTADLGTR